MNGSIKPCKSITTRFEKWETSWGCTSQSPVSLRNALLRCRNTKNEGLTPILAQDGVATGTLGQSRGISLACLLLMVGRRGDRQHRADRLDPVGLSMFIDE